MSVTVTDLIFFSEAEIKISFQITIEAAFSFTNLCFVT